MSDDLTVNLADLDVKVLRLQRGDVVALIATRPMTMDQAQAIREQWLARFPDQPVVVLEGFDIAVMRREHP